MIENESERKREGLKKWAILILRSMLLVVVFYIEGREIRKKNKVKERHLNEIVYSNIYTK